MSEEYEFDPMTGEKIVKKTEENVEMVEEISFDPMTGEKIVKMVPKKVEVEMVEEISFDPMTGEKIVKMVPKNKAAEATNSTAETKAEATAKVEPVNPNAPLSGAVVEENVSSNAEKKSGSKGPIIALVTVAAVVVVMLVGVIGVASGAFLSKTDRVLLASYKTVKKTDGFLEMDHVMDILNGSQYQVSGFAKISGSEIEVASCSYGKEKAVMIDIQGDSSSLNADAKITNNEVLVSVPEVTKKIISYNYKKKNDGFLLEEYDEESVKFVNNLLASIYNNTQTTYYNQHRKNLIKELRKFDFENTGKETILVNGKERKCNGYKTTIESKQLENILNTYVTTEKEYVEKELKITSGDLYEQYMDYLDNMIEDSMKSIEEFGEMDITVYLSKGCVVGVYADVEDAGEIKFQIHDTKNPLKDMSVVMEVGREEYEISWEGEITSKSEEYTLRADHTKVFELEYDKKDGSVNVEVAGLYNMEGKIEKKKNEISYSADIEVYSEVIKLGATFSSKPEKVKMDGERFDIGNASEDDMKDLIQDVEDFFDDKERILDGIGDYL